MSDTTPSIRATGPWEGWCDEKTIHPDLRAINDLRCDVYDSLCRDGVPHSLAVELAETIAARLWRHGYKALELRDGGEWE